MNDKIENLLNITDGLSGREFLRVIVEDFGDGIALASSFGAEDQVITHMLTGLDVECRIFTLDTGRLPQETYDLIVKTRQAYNIGIEMVSPDSTRLDDLTMTYGPNLFYESVSNRKLCCQIRKVEPLKRKLSQLDAWICGLRREQSVTREDLDMIEWDESNRLVKINPLADWATDQVWEYIHKFNVPYNALHDQGYPSIGCAPCTRSVKEGEDIRAGRWWWEQPEHKECGLHLQDGKLVPSKEIKYWIN